MEKEFKPFDITYKATMFSLSFSMTYPNPATEKWRLMTILVFTLTAVPMATLVLLDIERCWYEGNVHAVIRHIAMTWPFVVGMSKMCIMFQNRHRVAKLLAIINKDYEDFNNIADDQKQLVRSYIKSTRGYQYIWILCVLFILTTFVGVTTLINLYEYLFRAEPKRHMIYDVNLPKKELGAQLETPYFEILYFYMIYISIIFYLNFTSFDGVMLASINHACLKTELFVMYVNEAMKYQGQELRRRMARAVSFQCDIFKLVDICQASFSFYFGMVYLVITTELCVCLYLMTEGFEFDYKFTSFSIGTVLHMYVPCHVADRLKTVCGEVSTQIFCCGWEDMYDLPVRRYIPFMMARAQTPVTIKAFGLVAYEMELFVSTMKTGYSLYTLLKPK